MKNRTICSLIFFLAFALNASQTYAGTFVTGHELVEFQREYKKAESGASNTEYEKAWAYLTGVAMASDAMSYTSKNCAPTTVTRNQLGKIVSNYLDNHPELWDGDAFMLIYLAINEAFPCNG